VPAGPTAQPATATPDAAPTDVLPTALPGVGRGGGWRGSDRTTYSNRDSMLVVASSDVSNGIDSTSEPFSP
jgi:hypothetical protein